VSEEASDMTTWELDWSTSKLVEEVRRPLLSVCER